ncbi:NAD-dependent histone deacetylase SIR2 [Ceratobasidium sp. AG-Ba]|nr:NAD-dependent histone deacetylase SIR2 [Ceratobasidium sp. AG-Ba]
MHLNYPPNNAPDFDTKDAIMKAQSDDSLAIPVLSADDPAHAQAYCELQLLLSRAKHITVVCGAGMSTSAGIPDYRSAQGMYLYSPSTLGGHLNPKDFFDIWNLQNRSQLEAVGRALAEIRIKAEQAPTPEGQLYIRQLRQVGRLNRCYTQNVDGILTRGRPALEPYVLELHGRNELKCHRCNRPAEGDLRALDRILVKEGIAQCSRLECTSRGGGFSSRRMHCPDGQYEFRTLPAAMLLPDVVWNQDSRDHRLNNMTLHQLIERDGRADVLLVMGTTISTPGAARLVRELARLVQRHGGVAVYINRGATLPTSWAGYIALCVSCDIDSWAHGTSRMLCKAYSTVSTAALRCGVMDIVQRLRELKKQFSTLTITPSCPPATRPGLNCEPQLPIVVVLCHSGAATILCEAFAAALSKLSKQKQVLVGQIHRSQSAEVADLEQCQCFAMVVTGSEDASSLLPDP